MNFEKNKWVEIIEDAKKSPLTDQQIADLAIKFSNSGEVISLPFQNTADVPSTGGPSSLSTILTPLLLVKAGFVVPKLGVPGRPAGGLDTLSQLKGYKTEFSQRELREILLKTNYVHFISSEKFAPLDLEVFLLRKEIGAVAVPGLVIASLLSKKIALDVKNIGLDVRVAPHGNFGHNFDTSRLNARQFIRVAQLLDRRAICVLTDANLPFQPFIGRGEALWALHEVFESKKSSWLTQHLNQCKTIVEAMIGKEIDCSRCELKRFFNSNLEAQGTNYNLFVDKVKNVKMKHTKYIIRALESGFIYYDLGKLRSIIVSIQKKFTSRKSYSDPCGVRLLIQPSSYVEKGQNVMTVRIPKELWAVEKNNFQFSFKIFNQMEKRKDDEVINDG